jgi:hypothetical protein
MRTKLTVRQVRSPVTGLNADAMKAKLDDLDDYLDAIGVAEYDESGAISPNIGLALIDAAVPRQAMTLANGAAVGERVVFKLRSRVSIPAVDTDNDTLTFDEHGLSTGAGPYYIVSDENNVPGGLSPARQYWIINENDWLVKLALSEADATAGIAVDITSTGSGTLFLYQPYAIESVTHGSDSLEITGHDLADGDEVVFTVAGGAAPTGLSNGDTYYVIVVDPDNIQLAESLVDAEAGTQINLTGNGTGTMVLRKLVGDFHDIETSVRITPATMAGGTTLDLDSTSDRGVLIWTATGWAAHGTGLEIEGGELVSVGHGLNTGDGPYYIAATVTIPGGLAALTPYWFIRLTADRFQLAESEVDATDGVPVTITSAGAGTITLSRVLDVELFDNASDTIGITGHAIPDEATVRLAVGVGGALPAEFAPATTYYAIVGVDPDTLQLATSQPNAAADTEIDFTDDGTLPVVLYQLAYKTITAVDFVA